MPFISAWQDLSAQALQNEKGIIMSAYIDSIILFVLCSGFYPFIPPTVTSITCILLLISVYCFLLVSNKKILYILSIIPAMSLCLYHPALSVFLPFFCYIYFYRRHYIFTLPYALPLILYLYRSYTPMMLLIFPLFFLSLYLCAGTSSRQKFHRDMYSIRDYSVEEKMRLKELNQSILENRNNSIYIATLKERNRIAREIHDHVGHILSRSILHTGAMLTICKDENLKPHLETLNENLNTAMDNIRNSVHDLHDESIDLSAVLNSLAENFNFCPVSFKCSLNNEVPMDVKYCFIAITKEALNNIMRHSNATNACIVLKEHPAFFRLLIEDNGNTGNTFLNENTDMYSGKSSGIGLSNMRERVEALRGIINISSEKGFRIIVSIPKERNYYENCNY